MFANYAKVQVRLIYFKEEMKIKCCVMVLYGNCEQFLEAHILRGHGHTVYHDINPPCISLTSSL